MNSEIHNSHLINFFQERIDRIRSNTYSKAEFCELLTWYIQAHSSSKKEHLNEEWMRYAWIGWFLTQNHVDSDYVPSKFKENRPLE